MQKVSQSSAVVANGATTSTPIELNGGVVEAFIMPSALTSTTMTFEAVGAETRSGVQPLTGDFKQVVDTAGAPLSVTVAANKHIVINPRALSGCRWLRLVMGSAEGAARTIGVVIGRDG